MARRGWTLVSGGGSVSCMGELARAARAGGTRTVGIVPRALVDLEVADHDADELVVTDDMRARKGEMERRSDAFLALPGGIGTLEELVATGWPVLVSLSHKDFVGETLDLPIGERLTGTLAATAVTAWLGARVFRAHEVAETRQVLDMVASIRGSRPPAVARRGLA